MGPKRRTANTFKFLLLFLEKIWWLYPSPSRSKIRPTPFPDRSKIAPAMGHGGISAVFSHNFSLRLVPTTKKDFFQSAYHKIYIKNAQKGVVLRAQQWGKDVKCFINIVKIHFFQNSNFLRGNFKTCQRLIFEAYVIPYMLSWQTFLAIYKDGVFRIRYVRRII
jgi:hypothetical protein